MSMFGWVAAITAFAGIVMTGFGGLLGAVMQRNSTKIVSLLLAFAGGIMLSVVCFELIPDAFKPHNATAEMPLMLVIFGVIFGFGIIWLLNYIIDRNTNPEVKHIDAKHPHTADDLNELIHADHYNVHAHKKAQGNHDLFIAGIVMAFAIALHNMPEGMVIGASYAGDVGEITTGAGFLIAMVIGLHNIPEGMSVSVPLISGGMKKWKAVGVAALSGAPTVLGSMLGYSVGLLSPVWLSLSMSFAGGAMLYVVFSELLPESFLMWKSKAPGALTLVGTLVGIVLVYV